MLTLLDRSLKRWGGDPIVWAGLQDLHPEVQTWARLLLASGMAMDLDQRQVQAIRLANSRGQMVIPTLNMSDLI